MLLNNGVAFVAALTGIIFYKKFKQSNTRYFIYFLIYVSVFQELGNYNALFEQYSFLEPLKNLIEGTKFQNNYWWFTIFWNMASALFCSFYFQLILTNRNYKLIIRILTVIFFIGSLCYILLNMDAFFTRYLPVIKIGSAAIILTCCVGYFMEVLTSDLVLTFYRSINFYISAILFIWWLVTTPVAFFEIYFSVSDWSFIFLRWQVFLFMNLFMYLTFTFAFIWCKPETIELDPKQVI